MMKALVQKDIYVIWKQMRIFVLVLVLLSVVNSAFNTVGAAGGIGDFFRERSQCSHPAGEPLPWNYLPGHHLAGGAALRRGAGKDAFYGADFRRGGICGGSRGDGG